MRPSLSVTLEPGMEQGVPWGRDLYTFVTSAAGHMMRTLQKTRKNRPSKRQVNHRRFLHNMIQRKFADIEALNQLPSTPYEKEKDKDVSPLPSQTAETLDRPSVPSEAADLQDEDKCSLETHAEGIRNHKCPGHHEAEISGTGHLWKRQPKTQLTMFTARKNDESKGRPRKESRNDKLEEIPSMSALTGLSCCQRSDLFHTECYQDNSQPSSTNNSSEDSSFTHFEDNEDISLPFSPELSPLSLDSSDLSIQMFKDVLTQKSVADFSESQWTDIMDLFSVDSEESGGCMDVEAYFESICAHQGDAGEEVSFGGDGFAHQSDSLTRTQVEDFHCEAGDYRYEYGYSVRGDQGPTGDHNQKSTKDSTETQSNVSKPSFSCLYSPSEVQTYQQSPCLMVGRDNQNFTPFEGVAQSFSVPLCNPENRPIPTPPHVDDWLFTDILNDRK